MSEHAELPLPDYDHLPQGSLAHRIRSLDTGQLTALRDYERSHAARPAVLTIFQARLAELAEGAQPSGGDQRRQPEQAPPPQGGSPVGQGTGAVPSAPPHQGVHEQAARHQRS